MAEEEAHPAVVEEVAEATASSAETVAACKQLMLIKRQRKLFRFSLSFFSETVYNTFISNVVRNL